jgi:chloramphenicol 3-O-phosphotransferase
LTAAIVITGAPGSGKSSVAQAFTTLLDNAGVEHGAIETEQLAWGTPWLPDAFVHEQLALVLAAQRRFGRRLFVVVATTETQEDLDALLAAIGAERSLVVCLRAPGELCAERVLEREPERWAGREPLAAHARELAEAIPRLAGVDLVLETDGRSADVVAGELFAAYVNGAG